MSLVIRILLALLALGSMAYFVHSVRKNKLKVHDSIFWIVFSVVALIVAIFPEVVYWLSGLLGIRTPANLAYLIILAILIIRLFSEAVAISKLQTQVKSLTQELALLKKTYETRLEYRGVEHPAENEESADDKPI